MSPLNPFASALPGRIRLRHPALRNRDIHARVLDSLREFADIESNPAVGSMLLRFDPTDAELEARIRAEVAALLGPAEASPAEPGSETAATAPPPAPHGSRRRRRAKWELNRAAKIGAVASMALSLAALKSSRKLHAQAGVLSLALTLIHIVVHRRHVLR
ncbi:hypothetical protein M2323_004215 [Rhodoblastus acidophilus]|uniref:hypothetical protein n=1 Tax=Rhodoblastus acidophilus TaxID=1074 RepID=UPI00222450D6|nr:hypothetical protein [Rhodoblastus acidophilus]MCW2286420.1 hypothetical protein [Rhodoblastus acidophilus]MCW2335269.1 hypothetical protein [Rhodoblastus acidophilus]